ncbi:MAG TPA: hypothetical protein DEP20_03055 [Fusobacteria bacterium]|nr:hypothetical protein [Fusobacteriota bacterium]
MKDIKLKSDIVNPYQQLINNFPNIITKEKIRDLDNLILEVGCGSGKFLTKYSQMKAGNFVGIDTRYKRLVLAANKSIQFPNIFWCRSKAEEVVELLNKKAIKELHIYFPDPWPKKKHIKNRIANSDFLANVKKKMVKGAKLFLKTDDLNYFQFAEDNINKHFEILVKSYDLYKESAIEEASTEFENMFHKKGMKIKYLVAINTD